MATKPIVNINKPRPSTDNYDPTGLVIHQQQNAGKIADQVRFQQNQSGLIVQQVAAVELNVKSPPDSLVSYFSSLLGGSDEEAGAYLYTYSELTNAAEPEPSLYENLTNVADLREVFCIKSYIKDAALVSSLSPNDVVTGKFRNDSLLADFLPLDTIGALAKNIASTLAADLAFSQGSQGIDTPKISEERDCTSITGSDFEKWVEPVNGTISCPWGFRKQPAGDAKNERVLHAGIDLAAPMGAKIYAVYDGKVIQENKNRLEKNDLNALGIIKIEHNIINGSKHRVRANKIVDVKKEIVEQQELVAGKYISSYLHVSKIYVSTGQEVKAGDLIALVGGQPGTIGCGVGSNTGRPASTGPHLHLDIYAPNGLRIDAAAVMGLGKKQTANGRCSTLDVTSPNAQFGESNAEAEVASKFSGDIPVDEFGIPQTSES